MIGVLFTRCVSSINSGLTHRSSHMISIQKYGLSNGSQLFKPTQLGQPMRSFSLRQKMMNNNRRSVRRRFAAQIQEAVGQSFKSGDGTLLYRKAAKALGFTVLSTGVICCGSIVWQYENIKRYQKMFVSTYGYYQQKSYQAKSKLSELMMKLKESDKVFATLLALNVAVFLGWRVPAAQQFMIKYFSLNLFTKPTIAQMVLSTFSHQSGIHLFFNMYCLYTFIGPMVGALGKENFCALYFSSGIMASLFSVLQKTYRLSTSMTVGASGCILGVVAAFAMYHPDSRLSIIFLPMVHFSAQQALYGLIAFDVAGLVFGWRVVDHAAHLGGATFGLLYSQYAHTHLYPYRAAIIKYWKQISEP